MFIMSLLGISITGKPVVECAEICLLDVSLNKHMIHLLEHNLIIETVIWMNTD